MFYTSLDNSGTLESFHARVVEQWKVPRYLRNDFRLYWGCSRGKIRYEMHSASGMSKSQAPAELMRVQ